MGGFPLLYIFFNFFLHVYSACQFAIALWKCRDIFQKWIFFSDNLTDNQDIAPTFVLHGNILPWMTGDTERTSFLLSLLSLHLLISSRWTCWLFVFWSMSSSEYSCQTVGKFMRLSLGQVKNVYTPEFSHWYLLGCFLLCLSNTFQRKDVWGRWMRDS